MKLMLIAALALGAFIAIWVFFVIPAERRHHERKLEALRSRIEKRQEQRQEQDKYEAPPGSAADN